MTINNVVKALCKRTQHRWTTTPNIVIRLHTLLHIVACCYVSLGVIAQSKFETRQNFSYVQTDATIPNIVGPSLFGVVGSVCT